MARGPSGRLVIDVDPVLKRQLHSALAADAITLKEWLLQRVDEYLAEREQPRLPGIRYSAVETPIALAAEKPPDYNASKQ